MQYQFFNSSDDQQNAGGVIILLAISLFALIGTTALAIDLSKTMWSQAKIQGAFDAASLRAAHARYNGLLEEEALGIAQATARVNLQAAGLGPQKVNQVLAGLSVEFPPEENLVRVSGGVEHLNWFAAALPEGTPSLMARARSDAIWASPRTSVAAPTSYIFVFDVSYSMTKFKTADGRTRTEALQEAAKRLIDLLGAKDEVGILGFNDLDQQIADLALTDDVQKAGLKNVIDHLNTPGSPHAVKTLIKDPDQSHTNAAAGLAKAYEMLSNASNKQKRVIMMTDGMVNRTGTEQDLYDCSQSDRKDRAKGNAIEWADMIRKGKAVGGLNIPVYTVGFGLDKTSPKRRQEIEDFLRRVAGVGPTQTKCPTPLPLPQTPGDYRPATDADDLFDALKGFINPEGPATVVRLVR